MKNFSLVVLFFVIFSCSKKDDPVVIPVIPPVSTVGDDVVTTYFPMKTNNYWVYKTESSTATTPTIGRDSLFVEKDTTFANAVVYKKFKTLNGPKGFFSGSMRRNSLRVDGSSIKLSGAITVDLNNAIPLKFDVTDFVVFKENATTGQLLGESAGVITNTTAVPNVPLVLNYSLKTFEDGSLSSFSSNGNTYTDVKRTKTVLGLDIQATLSAGPPKISADLLSPKKQDVLVSYQYYAKGFGMIYTNTVIKYSLDATYASLLPPTVPATGNRSINELLLKKLINP